MSTRLHKRLGYGYVTPYGSEQPDAVPTILNHGSFLLQEEKIPFESPQAAWEDFAAFADAWAKGPDKRTMLLDPWWIRDRIKNSTRLPMVYESICQSDSEEFDDPFDVVLLTPLGLLDRWTRFDDAIDYVESQNIARDHTMEPEVHVFDDGLYPFNASYIRKDTLEHLDNIMGWIRARNDDTDYKDDLAQIAGFASHEEALALVIPKPPDDLVALELWSKLFVDETDAYKMSPIYYKYWR